jgi:O-antigen ligase
VLAAAAFEARPESSSPAFGATGARLGSIDSNRYSYWRVAFGTFADHPVQGIGSGGFVVEWLQERDVLDPTREPHSLYLGTLAELGVVGFAALLAFLGGVAAAASRLWRFDPGLTAGPAAALTVGAAHAGLDWDWEMPAVTLVALALTAALVAWSERPELSPGEREGSARASAPEPLASAPGPPPA